MRTYPEIAIAIVCQCGHQPGQSIAGFVCFYYFAVMKLSQPCGPGADPDVSVKITQNGIYTRSCQSLGHGVDINGLALNAKEALPFRADPDIVLAVIDDRVVADRILQPDS